MISAVGVAQAQPQPRQQTPPLVEGFVIYEGQYLAPPYVLVWENDLLTLNDLPMQTPRPQRPYRRGPGASGRRPLFNMPPSRAAAWIQRRLGQGSLLICWADQPSVFIAAEQVNDVLATLSGDAGEAAKADRLQEAGPAWMSRSQWVELIQRFSGSPALQERLLAAEESPPLPVPAEAEQWSSDRFIAGFTISGFVLAVLALGLLLKSRYPSAAPDPRGASRQVIELVLLLVFLNLYDLICTLFASAIGGLWELNPFAGSMMNESILVVLYKAGLTLGAALLLIVARHRRVAQLATYWCTVIYTVLILRWITYNAMFMV
jgi:hypothetical protein